jgi:TPP-dependent pyruvate/acetoin dehydrogenase alpha subunit
MDLYTIGRFYSLAMSNWVETRPDESQLYRIIAPDGSLEREPPRLEADELLKFYQTMILTRTFEQKALKMTRRGEISIVTLCKGEEATPVGSIAALEAGDWCFPYYRQRPALLYWDLPLSKMLANLMGAEPETVEKHLPHSEESKPEVNFPPVYVPLGVNVTNAVGSAMIDGFEGNEQVTLAYVGDGSTSQGDFHDALNFAGVFEAPVVIICQNNQWAISVPSQRQTAAESYAKKAEAYGIPHERVDGNDVFAVYEKTNEAVERARNGDGPTFIECVTYRMVDHNTADENNAYRSEDEFKFWATRDPVDRLETYLRHEDVLNDVLIEEINESTESKVEEAVHTARKVPISDPATMFANHLHDTHWKIEHQREELNAELSGENPFTDFTGGGLQ